MQTSLKLALLLSLCASLTAACTTSKSSTRDDDDDDDRQEKRAEVKNDAVDSFPPELEGYYYDGDWGTIVIRGMGGDRVRASYNHDNGTIEGRWVDGKLVGWWCETPSRRANEDAGEVELTFIREGETTRIDGRWRYGTSANEPEWREDWDVSRTSPQVPPSELVDRFGDETAFCPKPSM